MGKFDTWLLSPLATITLSYIERRPSANQPDHEPATVDTGYSRAVTVPVLDYEWAWSDQAEETAVDFSGDRLGKAEKEVEAFTTIIIS